MISQEMTITMNQVIGCQWDQRNPLPQASQQAAQHPIWPSKIDVCQTKLLHLDSEPSKKHRIRGLRCQTQGGGMADILIQQLQYQCLKGQVSLAKGIKGGVSWCPSSSHEDHCQGHLCSVDNIQQSQVVWWCQKDLLGLTGNWWSCCGQNHFPCWVWSLGVRSFGSKTTQRDNLLIWMRLTMTSVIQAAPRVVLAPCVILQSTQCSKEEQQQEQSN